MKKKTLEFISWLPFMPFSKNFNESLKDEKGNYKENHFKYYVRTSSSSVLFAAGIIFYGLLSIGGRSINFTKWPEQWEKTRTKNELNFQKESSEKFKHWDFNNDGLIDSTEFLKLYKSYDEHLSF